MSAARDFIETLGIEPQGLSEEGRALAGKLGLNPDDPATAKEVLVFLMERLTSKP